MAGKVLVDALSYIDEGYDEPGIREAVISMIEDEKRRFRPSNNYLERFPSLNTSRFETELMRTEFDRLQQRLSMETMSMQPYELPPPPAVKLPDMSSWNECLENSMVQLEHQAT
ncbi:pre-mRNA-splicing factor SPF27-like, partial [Myzus persicae]